MQISHSHMDDPHFTVKHQLPSLTDTVVFAQTDIATRCDLVDYDPCSTEINVSPLDIVILPDGAGIFSSHRQCLITPLITLYEESYTGRADMLGVTPSGVITISLPLSCDGDTKYFQQQIRSGELFAGIAANFHVRFSARHRHLVILLQLGQLSNLLDAENMERLLALAGVNRLVLPPVLLSSIAARLRHFLHITRDAPEMLASEFLASQLELEMLDCLLELIAHSTPHADHALDRQNLRQRGFERAIDILFSIETPEDIPSIPRLSVAAGVSQRTLEYAFRERTGMSPKAFIRARRYHHMRRSLLRSPTTSVRDCAMQAGLFEFGRVAAEYRDLFGELPSQTASADRLGQQQDTLR